jgi:hypothetical protein
VTFDLFRGVGYPSLWPSDSCREPLDVSKNFTFEVIDGILSGDTYRFCQRKWSGSWACYLKRSLVCGHAPKVQVIHKNREPRKRIHYVHTITSPPLKENSKYIRQLPNRVQTLCCFSDFSKVFKFKFAHLGGDEVNTSKHKYCICSCLLIYIEQYIYKSYPFTLFSEFQAAGPQHHTLKDGI